jgi:hypothetical protein
MFSLHVSFMDALVAVYSQRCLSSMSRGHVESFSVESMRLGACVNLKCVSDSPFNSDAYSTSHSSNTKRLLQSPPAPAGSSLAESSTLKMEAISSSETSVHTRSTRRHISEDGILQIRVVLVGKICST